MLTFDVIQARFAEVNGADVTTVIAFIDKMKQARTSAFYSDAIQEEYRNLNIQDLYRIIATNSRFSIRKQVIANKIRVAAAAFVSDVDYF